MQLLIVLLFALQFYVCVSFHNSRITFQSAFHRGKDIDRRQQQQGSNEQALCTVRYRGGFLLLSTNDDVENALQVLRKYDEEYIERMKLTRASIGRGRGNGGLVEVKTPKQVEFERAQILKVIMIIRDSEFNLTRCLTTLAQRSFTNAQLSTPLFMAGGWD